MSNEKRAADAQPSKQPTPSIPHAVADSQAWEAFAASYWESAQKAPVHPPNAAGHCVTIFGAGVAGLTAAHELIERGFRVQVWDPVFDERDPSRGCDVGGMARTQWSRAPWHEGADAGARMKLPSWEDRETSRILHLPWVFYTAGDPLDPRIIGAVGERTAYFRKQPIDSTNLANDPDDLAGLRAIVQEMAQALMSPGNRYDGSIYCEVQRLVPSSAIGRDRAQRVIDSLKELCEPYVLELSKEEGPYSELLIATVATKDGVRVVRFQITLLDDFPDGLPTGVGERISFRMRERWIAGEHGFRFFPAFYRHIFDTMNRTPLLEPAPKSTTGASQERAVSVDPNPDKYIETGRTVFDNLRATTKQVISLPNGIGPTVLSRSLPKSLEELRDWSRLVLQAAPKAGDKVKGGFGFTVRDLALFQLKFLQYMTSCSKRREEYEHMTWFEYLGGERAYSDAFVDILNSIPQALVAMDAMVSDARTQGSVFAQLLLDNVKPDGYRDGTLSGPTSVVWLNPWRRYLEAQGVEFIHGKITGFKRMLSPVPSSGASQWLMWPTVECYEPRYPGALDENVALMPGYFLLALPAGEMRKVTRSFVDECRKPLPAQDNVTPPHPLCANGDIARAAKYLTDHDVQIDVASPKGALRHMVGIQYYFDEDIYWRDGHFYLPHSKWGISAISQVRFWQDKHDWEHGYRGVLSVVFTVLEPETHRAGEPLEPESLFSLPRDQIALEIWKEIVRSIQDQPLPTPRYWHMDFGFRRFERDGASAEHFYQNETPMLINIPGRWDDRPGDLIEICDRDIKLKGQYSKYKVEQGVVLAGTMMKTHTRLTTMEAANESGRHAVNAILQDAEHLDQNDGASETYSRHSYTPCDIWPLELDEIDDFKFLKELDEELYERGLDHFLDILDLPELFRTALRGTRDSVRDQFDPLRILSQLDRVLMSLKGDITTVIRKHNDHKGVL